MLILVDHGLLVVHRANHGRVLTSAQRTTAFGFFLPPFIHTRLGEWLQGVCHHHITLGMVSAPRRTARSPWAMLQLR